jgi:hypothetical protein
VGAGTGRACPGPGAGLETPTTRTQILRSWQGGGRATSLQRVDASGPVPERGYEDASEGRRFERARAHEGHARAARTNDTHVHGTALEEMARKRRDFGSVQPRWDAAGEGAREHGRCGPARTGPSLGRGPPQAPRPTATNRVNLKAGRVGDQADAAPCVSPRPQAPPPPPTQRQSRADDVCQCARGGRQGGAGHISRAVPQGPIQAGPGLPQESCRRRSSARRRWPRPPRPPPLSWRGLGGRAAGCLAKLPAGGAHSDSGRPGPGLLSGTMGDGVFDEALAGTG